MQPEKLNREKCVFIPDAQNLFNSLVKLYSDKIRFGFLHYDNQNKNGVFYQSGSAYYIKIWHSGSIEYDLLVLIHELAHYHHCIRGKPGAQQTYSKFKNEYYAFLYGWAFIAKNQMKKSISKNIWYRFSKGGYTRTDFGLKPIHYSEVEKRAKEEQ